jgi:hypothetical protein
MLEGIILFITVNSLILALIATFVYDRANILSAPGRRIERISEKVREVSLYVAAVGGFLIINIVVASAFQ